jgi:hypothetical protein
MGLLAALLTILIAGTFLGAAPKEARLQEAEVVIQPTVTEALESDTEVPVIISLQLPDSDWIALSLDAIQQDVAARQSRVLAAVDGSGFTLTNK